MREQKMADYRAAVPACIMANSNRTKGSKIVEPADLFPSLNTKKKMTKEQMKKHMQTIARKMKR